MGFISAASSDESRQKVMESDVPTKVPKKTWCGLKSQQYRHLNQLHKVSATRWGRFEKPFNFN